MFDRPPILVGLELGTAKVCALVGEVQPDGQPRIIGVGQAPSHGVRKGEITNPALAEEDIRAAIDDVERTADVEVRSVILGVSGGHLQGFNNRGLHTIVSADHEILPEDVGDVVRNAKAINVPADHHVLHAIRQHFVVDGQEDIPDPVGMLGSRLEVEMHVTHGKASRIQNAIRVVRGLHLEVQEVVFNGLASSLALLTRQQKELGALILDLGAGVTDYVVYGRGVVRHSGVLAVGGDHVSYDLANGLRVPQGRAEQLKIGHGGAFPDDSVRGRVLEGLSEHGLPETPVNLEHLRRIMHVRLEETLDIVREELEEKGVLHHVRGSVHLCGGGARIPGITELATRIFGLPAVVGTNAGVSSVPSGLDQPEFATALGLLRYGALQHGPRPEARRSGWRGLLPGPLRQLMPG